MIVTLHTYEVVCHLKQLHLHLHDKLLTIINHCDTNTKFKGNKCVTL